LWWLSLLVACNAEQTDIDQALHIIAQEGSDALLDTISVHLGDKNRPIADTLYYPAPYQHLLNAFECPVAQRAEHVNAFITAWYDNLEQADWFDNHQCDLEFEYTDYYIGYWCLEAALVANLLDIPLSLLHANAVLPKDLILIN